MEHSFSPNSSGDLRSDAHRSQIFGGDADEDHTQIIGGDTVKLLGGYIPHPPPPPGFRHPCREDYFFALLILSSRRSGDSFLGFNAGSLYAK